MSGLTPSCGLVVITGYMCILCQQSTVNLILLHAKLNRSLSREMVDSFVDSDLVVRFIVIRFIDCLIDIQFVDGIDIQEC